VLVIFLIVIAGGCSPKGNGQIQPKATQKPETCKDGTVVWEQQLKYDLGNGAAISEKKYRPDRNTLVYYPEFSGLADSQVQAKLNKELENLAIAENPKADEEYESTYEGNFEVDFHTPALVSIKMSGYDYMLGAAHGMPLSVPL